MQVTSYQMHNVLQCYSKKLSRMRKTDESTGCSPKNSVEEPTISPETTRQATMEKISRQVLDKIADVVSLAPASEGTSQPPLTEDTDSMPSEESAAPEFASNVIDSINQKHTANLTVKDSAALIRRLEQMREKTLSHKTDSWV